MIITSFGRFLLSLGFNHLNLISDEGEEVLAELFDGLCSSYLLLFHLREVLPTFQISVDNNELKSGAAVTNSSDERVLGDFTAPFRGPLIKSID